MYLLFHIVTRVNRLRKYTKARIALRIPANTDQLKTLQIGERFVKAMKQKDMDPEFYVGCDAGGR